VLFNTLPFALFFTAVFCGWWALQRWQAPRFVFLLAASIFFYASWNWRYIFLLLAVTVVDWALALLLERTHSTVGRKAIVFATCTANLGALAFWKYSNFLLDTVRPLGDSLGWHVPGPLQLVLPVGISFYSFQGLGYVIDVYRGQMAPVRSLPRFFLCKAFFPQLVAGPIVRPSVLVPQFEQPRALDADRLGRGLELILCGLIKKAAADYLAANLVDRVFDLPEHYSSTETLAAIYGYALQIYGDFSGYTDVAIGSAALLGFDLPPNFDHPYRALNLREFWRRWHISLSTWLRDYLYIPLGGSRGGYWRTQLNLVITMLLGGLWHGASWTFVVWGGLHGAWLVLERVWDRMWGRRENDPPPAWPGRILSTLVTFHVVCVLWVFFRSDSFSGATKVLEQVFVGGPGTANVPQPVLLVLAGGIASHFIPRDWRQRVDGLFVRAPAFAQAVVVLVCLYGLRALSGGEAQPFIYFQF
jgi:D-alanyl-lipoteichoic acid acyltransferase DltB (MBOAT superfamily)